MNLIAVRTENGLVHVNPDHIIYVEERGEVIRLQLTNGSVVVAVESIGTIYNLIRGARLSA
jgi:uncharacterized protein YlzI (FlbEa/FlbD family)